MYEFGKHCLVCGITPAVVHVQLILNIWNIKTCGLMRFKFEMHEKVEETCCSALRSVALSSRCRRCVTRYPCIIIIFASGVGFLWLWEERGCSSALGTECVCASWISLPLDAAGKKKALHLPHLLPPFFPNQLLNEWL